MKIDETDARIIALEIDEAAASMAECYKYLPAAAQASVIRLGHALSNLKMKMTVQKYEPPRGGADG